eukprot:CAMPEP_0194144876 /NCGR_PEP_ID=MMETSP0152-20130528/13864_1 /TAXON_ID=1049557 /ORGANISM="Thalassiothrix antarctica, Strain L6-D1" /LENGTH=1413 /DNA_ID=CAMNT_0038844891 /DNA_START=70 /DNA_END=4311 /DNA_ORIENTATION=-
MSKKRLGPTIDKNKDGLNDEKKLTNSVPKRKWDQEVDEKMNDVENGEEMEDGENSDEMEDVENAEDMEDVENAEETESSFLDTFYGLSSESSMERSQAAHMLLDYCLIGSTANLKDATYTLRRLLSSLCSGKTAARQGYASTLTSFLKVSHKHGILENIKNSEGGDSILSFVRELLLESTSTKQCDPEKNGEKKGSEEQDNTKQRDSKKSGKKKGKKKGSEEPDNTKQGDTEKNVKKKGSEERDNQLGRLFGILSVIRSGILFPKDDTCEIDQIKNVSSGFVSDLISLYNNYEWMREPAAYAIIHLIDFFYALSSEKGASEIVRYLVSEVVVPNMLCPVSLEDYTMEQLAVALNIQAQSKDHGITLPKKLKTAFLCKSTMPIIAKSLSATSSVPQPRIHMVWDVILCSFLTTSTGTNAKSSKDKIQTRILRKELPGCKDTASDVVESLFEHVIVDILLGVEQESGISPSMHERRELALSLVEVLCGREYYSPKGSPFRIQIDGYLLKASILKPVIVQNLFIDAITISKEGQHASFLKTMSLSVLEFIVSSSEVFSDGLGRRLACAEAFLSCDPRFDSRTKSLTCNALLYFDDVETITPDLLKMWEEYADFLIKQIFSTSSKNNTHSEGSASYEAIGYVNLIYNLAKRILRSSQNIKHDIIMRMIQKILSFFFVGAFFDCSEMKDVSDVGLEAAMVMKKSLTGKDILFPHAIRIVVAARFYSLLADFAMTSSLHNSSPNEKKGKSAKNSLLLELLIGYSKDWKKLEIQGCKRMGEKNDVEDEEEAVGLVTKQQEAAIEKKGDLSEGLHCFKIGCATLNSILSLHLLRCGYADEMVENEEMNLDEEDDLEIREFIFDLGSAQNALMVELELLEKGDEDEDEEQSENALSTFARVCGGILSSQFNDCGESRGASSKLLREAVKMVWSNALALCAEYKGKMRQYDNSLRMILLELIGVDSEESEPEEEDDENSSVDSENTDDSDENDDGVFAIAAASGLDVEDRDEFSEKGKDVDVDMIGEKDDDVNLDNEELQTMLMEDISDGEEVEHHAGADAALAQLIKLKQDARKAGQQARERVALSNHTRCILLFEIILRQADSHSLSSDFLSGIFLPLLRTRRRLEKAVMKGAVGQTTINEKRVMVEKLTSLMQTKLFKIKTYPEINEQEFSKLVPNVMNEIQEADSDEHLECSSSTLIVFCKMARSKNSITCLSTAYSSLVNEWATKRTTIKTNIFENLMQQQLSIAKVLLVSPLCQASGDARNNFLKSECFRLLSILLSLNKMNPESSASETCEMGDKVVRKNYNLFAKSLLEAIKNDEMRKGKRVRELLKTIEKFIDYIDRKAGEEATLNDIMKALVAEIISLKSASESSGVTSVCDSLTLKINEYISKSQARIIKDNKVVETQQVKKKKKKKKGKKK